MVEAIEDDPTFWQAAYGEHGPSVLAFLRRRLGGSEEAEDLLQETFVRAIRAGSFQRGGHLRAYLLRIARNLLINRLRRPRLVVSAEPSVEGADPFAAVADGAARSPERSAAWAAFEARLGEVLAAMKPAHRQAFQLGVIEQRSYQEVMGLTGWSLSQVKINVYRARRQVLAELGEQIPDIGGEER